MATQPPPEEIAKWDRWFAVEMNSQAWNLAEKPELTESDRDAMLHTAHTSALHWDRVGTDLNRARADMLLGQVYGTLGHGVLAMRYAQRGFAYVTSHDSPDWEIAFAHLALARAAQSAHDIPLFEKHRAEAVQRGEDLANPKDKEIFQRSLALLPKS